MKRFIFRVITPCHPLKVNRHFEGTCDLHLQGQRMSQARNQHEGRWQVEAFTLVSCLAYFSTLKMEATCSSKMLVDFLLTTRRYNPENRKLHNHCCTNLKAYT
jgi:hypothetical protein